MPKKGYKQSEEHKNKLNVIKSSLEYRQRISKANSGEQNGMYGKPSWNKGKHCSEETKRKISIANLGKKQSDESKQKISKNWNGGARKSFYNGTWFRSGWEAKYAKWLDENEIEWEYEPIKFRLNMDKECTYTPDFFLPKFNIYHEIKGYIRKNRDDLKRIELARLQYAISITVIDEKYLKRLKIL